jgi:hypothetical protein
MLQEVAGIGIGDGSDVKDESRIVARLGSRYHADCFGARAGTIWSGTGIGVGEEMELAVRMEKLEDCGRGCGHRRGKRDTRTTTGWV